MRASAWKGSPSERASGAGWVHTSGNKWRAAVCWLPLCLFACGSDNPNDGTSPPDMNPVLQGGNDSGTGAVASSDAGSGSTSDAGGVSTGGIKDAGVGATLDAGATSGDGGARDSGTSGPVADAQVSGDAGATAGGACTRESLAAAVETYFKALSARAPAMLNAAPTVKFTQDAKLMDLGQGLWTTAGAVRFKRSALDTVQCETVSESVVDNAGQDFIVGVRLKLAAGLISEIETILVGPDGWFPNPMNVISSASDNWEMLLPDTERPTRDKLKTDIIDGYFEGLFGGKIKAADFPFASTCKRAENGFSPGACNFGIPTSMPMTPLHYVMDVEAGIGVGFVLFGGSGSGLLDFHMFRVKSGQVYGVRAVVGPSARSRGWP